LLLIFALCPSARTVCTTGCHAQFGFNLCPSVGLTNAAVIVGIGLEWNSVPSPKFVQPGCTATTNRIQVGEMLLREKGARTTKKEGPRFMQRPVAKWRTRGAVGKISDRYQVS
jgi:hypothetical protein